MLRRPRPLLATFGWTGSKTIFRVTERQKSSNRNLDSSRVTFGLEWECEVTGHGEVRAHQYRTVHVDKQWKRLQCLPAPTTFAPKIQTRLNGRVSIKGGPTSKSFKATSSNPAESLRPRLHLGGGEKG